MPGHSNLNYKDKISRDSHIRGSLLFVALKDIIGQGVV